MSEIVSKKNTFTFPVCNKCKHYEGGGKCSAFNSIPKEILIGDNNHSEPLPDQDNDIVFEPLPTT
jgi:hypothetical protein